MREDLPLSFGGIEAPPVQPSGFVPGWDWGGATAVWHAIGRKQGSDCLKAIFVRVFVVKAKGHIVFFYSSGPPYKSSTAE
jgi:hypothetical protein